MERMISFKLKLNGKRKRVFLGTSGRRNNKSRAKARASSSVWTGAQTGFWFSVTSGKTNQKGATGKHTNQIMFHCITLSQESPLDQMLWRLFKVAVRTLKQEKLSGADVWKRLWAPITVCSSLRSNSRQGFSNDAAIFTCAPSQIIITYIRLEPREILLVSDRNVSCSNGDFRYFMRNCRPDYQITRINLLTVWLIRIGLDEENSISALWS